MAQDFASKSRPMIISPPPSMLEVDEVPVLRPMDDWLLTASACYLKRRFCVRRTVPWLKFPSNLRSTPAFSIPPLLPPVLPNGSGRMEGDIMHTKQGRMHSPTMRYAQNIYFSNTTLKHCSTTTLVLDLWFAKH